MLKKITAVFYHVKSTNTDCNWAVHFDAINDKGFKYNGYKPFWHKVDALKWYNETLQGIE